jgi:hypothetical protein
MGEALRLRPFSSFSNEGDAPMALPTRRFRVAGTLFGLGGKAGRDREQADHRQRHDSQPQHNESQHNEPQDCRWTSEGSKPDGVGSPRTFMSRADVERAHPPRVYRLEGATWCEVKTGGKRVD